MRKLLPRSRDENTWLPTPTIGKRKRFQVQVACDACRRRKIKCDTRRPACSQCVRSVNECRFAVPDDTSRHGAGLNQL
ncbi:hypothetical protein FVEN_g9640 [Fusarium venenatum]|nr:hypothetical protein FVEN_g9640 [Fusarium venenatum]